MPVAAMSCKEDEWIEKRQDRPPAQRAALARAPEGWNSQLAPLPPAEGEPVETMAASLSVQSLHGDVAEIVNYYSALVQSYSALAQDINASLHSLDVQIKRVGSAGHLVFTQNYDLFLEQIQTYTQSGASLSNAWDDVLVEEYTAIGQQISAANAFVPSPHAQIISNAIDGDLWEHFGHLCEVAGPFATTSGRSEEKLFWQSCGEDGSRWLIERLGEPRDLRYEWRISGLLSELAPASVGPILEALSDDPSYELLLALLSALAGMRCDLDPSAHERVESLLRRYLESPDDVVRRSAGAATAVLRPERSALVLAFGLENEADSEVRAALEDELAQLRR